MIKVSVLYPKKPGTHFDMKYYLGHHMPLAMKLLAKGLRKTEADEGLHGAGPNEEPAYFGGCRFYFDSEEAFLAVWGPASAELVADIPKYTNTTPIIQFNEVKLST